MCCTCSFTQVPFDNNYTRGYNIYDVIFMVRDLVSIVNAVTCIIKSGVHYFNDLLTRIYTADWDLNLFSFFW